MSEVMRLRKMVADIKKAERRKKVETAENLLLRGYSRCEIAEIMCLSESTVRSLMTDIGEETLREGIWA